ncbi:hypothetical protein Y032_0234g3126 [Ancylostoma ceylanicum]|uniref:Uncharacterized protein n=1 Tax=Ancylostoma ceylanicum TaxID=53326 RepID=A0A016SFY0_9BILA|nr:hypothetical protein Y032_0234g3126 [Ancylostoma ceylanicum]
MRPRRSRWSRHRSGESGFFGSCSSHLMLTNKNLTSYQENPIVCCLGEDFCSSGAVALRASRNRGRVSAIDTHCTTVSIAYRTTSTKKFSKLRPFDVRTPPIQNRQQYFVHFEFSGIGYCSFVDISLWIASI